MRMNDLVKQAHEMAKSKGWWDDERLPLELHMLIVSEIAEASECYRNHEPVVWTDPKGKPSGEAVELADAIIRIMDYFGRRGWDMEKIMKMKMEYNSGRPHRHGGKKA